MHQVCIAQIQAQYQRLMGILIYLAHICPNISQACLDHEPRVYNSAQEFEKKKSCKKEEVSHYVILIFSILGTSDSD